LLSMLGCNPRMPPVLLTQECVCKVGDGLAGHPSDCHPTANPWHVRLLTDPVSPERLFCVHARGAHVLSAPWIPLLASQLGERTPPLLTGVPFALPETPSQGCACVKSPNRSTPGLQTGTPFPPSDHRACYHLRPIIPSFFLPSRLKVCSAPPLAYANSPSA